MKPGIPKKIVLCEDDDLLNDIVSVMLAGQGYAVRCTHDGLTCLSECRADPPDLLVLDLHLPDHAGADVLSVLRADRRFRRLPVVIVSADESSAPKALVDRLGVSAFVSKPFNANQLVDEVRRQLGRDA